MKIPGRRKRVRKAFGGCHVEYHHKRRPTRIELRCPRCGGMAIAHEPCEHPCTIHHDLAPQWFEGGVFEVVCTQCLYRESNVKYVQLGEAYHQVRVGRITLWAWNRQHLLTMRRYLAKEPYEGRPYYGLMIYVRQPWLRRRELFVKAIDAYVAGLRRQ